MTARHGQKGMTMKRYYISYPRNFTNEYVLRSVEHGTKQEKFLIDRGWERITRKEAESLCARERDRRRYDRAMSGYAPATIEEFTEREMHYLMED